MRGRRHFLRAAGAIALATAVPTLSAAGDQAVPLPVVPPLLPIADSHSHIGLHRQGGYRGSLKSDMESAGIMLMAWTIVGDGRWTLRTSRGIEQRSTPSR